MKLSVIVPSIGRPALLPLIHSLPGAWVEWVIVFDGSRRDRQINIIERQRELERIGLEWHTCLEGGDYGQEQRNHGMTKATGEWLAFSQDDQVFEDGAAETLFNLEPWQSERHYAPQLFRLRKWTPQNENLVWRERGTFELGMVDGDCMVVPNVQDRLGRWGAGYCGDWEFLRATAEHWGGVEWRDEVIQRGV